MFAARFELPATDRCRNVRVYRKIERLVPWFCLRRLLRVLRAAIAALILCQLGQEHLALQCGFLAVRALGELGREKISKCFGAVARQAPRLLLLLAAGEENIESIEIE